MSAIRGLEPDEYDNSGIFVYKDDTGWRDIDTLPLLNKRWRKDKRYQVKESLRFYSVFCNYSVKNCCFECLLPVGRVGVYNFKERF